MAEMRDACVSISTEAGCEIFIPAPPASVMHFCDLCNQPILSAEIKITRTWPRKIAKFLAGDADA